MFTPYFEETIDKMVHSSVDGVKRSFLKIYAEYVPDLKPIPNLGLLVQYCFEWLMNPKETIAVRMYSIDVLFRVAQFEPDLKNEIRAVAEFQLPYGSVGFKNRTSKILAKL